jgi:alkanesulfonate monooxygenase SsuD/methylene tetrahydromethanopterin reductase-like flavin-dependent oxidoreductase (luciferase family)
MKTYSEDELISAVNEAVAPLLAELTSLREKESQEQVEARIAEAEAAAAAKATEIQNQLDAAELRATEAEKARDDVLAWLQAEAQAIEEATLVESLREARRDAVKQLATAFTDEQIEAKLDRWVAMDEDTFEEFLEGLKVVSAASTASRESLPVAIPVETAMSHTRNTTTQGSSSAVGELFELLKSNVDPRTL